jgi:predicted amidohydrolase
MAGDVQANLADHVRLIQLAAREQAQVLVFPELSLTGYELELAHELAFTAHNARLTPLVELAELHRITIIAGAPVQIEGHFHIGAFIFAADGSIDVYTKHHLGAFPPDANGGGPVPPAETTVFQPGRRNPLVHFHGHTAAVAVCADIARPAHAEEAVRRGARNYLASTFVIPADLDKDLGRLKTYVVQHALTVVFANFGGPSGGLPSAGSSAIISAGGDVLARLPRSGAGLALAREATTGWEGWTIEAQGG